MPVSKCVNITADNVTIQYHCFTLLFIQCQPFQVLWYNCDIAHINRKQWYLCMSGYRPIVSSHKTVTKEQYGGKTKHCVLLNNVQGD